MGDPQLTQVFHGLVGVEVECPDYIDMQEVQCLLLDCIHFEQLLARVNDLLDDLDVFFVHVFAFGVHLPVVIVRLLDPVDELY